VSLGECPMWAGWTMPELCQTSEKSNKTIYLRSVLIKAGLSVFIAAGECRDVMSDDNAAFSVSERGQRQAEVHNVLHVLRPHPD